MDTVFPKIEEKDRKWYLVDAQEAPVGRLATKIARLLTGKNKPIWSPHIDGGDYVVVINANKSNVTGNKRTDKKYYSYSGYISGLKEVPFRRMLLRHPERIIEKAVWGMLPKTRLGRKMYTKLKVYAGESHPHSAQQPTKLTF
ncbi:MAG: 50S ribosomal protein L13 [Caldisericia bacterium]|jgi:large subunit ribosomal protein L13|nr:50S ribosomal protein L13 [Caldisericia bacterium]